MGERRRQVDSRRRIRGSPGSPGEPGEPRRTHALFLMANCGKWRSETDKVWATMHAEEVAES